MPDREYWRKRYLKDKARAVNAAEDFIRRDTKKYYMQAAKEIQADIEKFYKKYAAENGVTLSEAKRRISQADFDGIDWEQLCRNESELDRELKKKKDSLPGDVVARMERERIEYEDRIKTLSAKGNITRMELLQAEIDKAVLELQDAQQINIFDLLRNEYEDGYYHGMYSTQQCMGFGYDFAAVNTRAVEKAVLNPRRSNYSKTIYKHQKNLKKELTECLTVGMIKGEGIDKTIGRVQRRLEVSHSNARRLVRTETAYIYEQAMLDVYTECGITEYEYLATLDKKTSEICQELDGKRFKIADALPGTNYPPMHPNCRSTTVAAFDDDVPSRRAARDDAGKYYTVPSDMSYKEWKAKYVPDVPPDAKEYRIIQEDGKKAPKEEIRNFKMVVKNLSRNVKKALGDVTIKTGSSYGNAFSPSENAIYLVNGAGRKEITHEIGHAIEKKLFDERKLKSLKKYLMEGVGAEDILVMQGVDDSGNIRNNIFIVDNRRFIDKYQGRIYADSMEDCFDGSGNIDIDKMHEIVSVAYSYYVTSPKTMKKYYPEMYEFIRNSVE